MEAKFFSYWESGFVDKVDLLAIAVLLTRLNSLKFKFEDSMSSETLLL